MTVATRGHRRRSGICCRSGSTGAGTSATSASALCRPWSGWYSSPPRRSSRRCSGSATGSCRRARGTACATWRRCPTLMILTTAWTLGEVWGVITRRP